MKFKNPIRNTGSIIVCLFGLFGLLVGISYSLLLIDTLTIIIGECHRDGPIKINQVDGVSCIVIVDCIEDGDFHWGGYYPQHSGEMGTDYVDRGGNTKHIHQPQGEHCTKAWCKSCKQFVCISLYRH